MQNMIAEQIPDVVSFLHCYWKEAATSFSCDISHTFLILVELCIICFSHIVPNVEKFSG